MTFWLFRDITIHGRALLIKTKRGVDDYFGANYQPRLTNSRIHHYFNYAKNASFQSDFPKHQLGASVVYKGTVLATGSNLSKTSPIQKKYNRKRNYSINAPFSRTNCLHAEVNCLNKIKSLDIDFSRVNLFVYREHKDGTPAMARPCKACVAFAKDLGVKHIFYTTENGYAYERIEEIEQR